MYDGYLPPRVELPTWIGAQWYFIVLDSSSFLHTFPPRGVKPTLMHTFPWTTAPSPCKIPNVAAPEPIVILEHRRRFRFFPPDPECLMDKYNVAFAHVMGSALPASVPDQFQHIRDALVGAALTVYVEPVAYNRLPAMVRQKQESFRAFLLSQPFWWNRLEHLHRGLTLWRAVHTAWCITTLESQLGLSRHNRHKQPSARSYRRVLGRELGPSMEPKYVVGMSMNLCRRAPMTLHQLC